MSPRLRLGSRITARSSGRASLVAFIGVLLATGLVAAAVVIPLSVPRQSPGQSAVAVAASGEESATASSAVETEAGPSESLDPLNSPIVEGSTPPDTGGDWYRDLKVTYPQTIHGGNSGRITVTGNTKGSCVGRYSYRLGSDRFDNTTYAIGQDIADPWQGKFDVAEPFVGKLHIQFTCYSAGYMLGYAHTYYLNVQVLAALPWAIHGGLSGYIGEGLTFNYEVRDPNWNDPWGWKDGRCALTVAIPGQAPISQQPIYWYQGKSYETSVTTIPADAAPGTVTWSLTCTDGTLGAPENWSTTWSANGSYELAARPTAAPPTTAPTPTPTTPPDPTPEPSPTPEG